MALAVIVCGGRDYTDAETMRRELGRLPSGTVVIHGAARGADSLAGDIAHELGLEVRAFPADWKLHGRAAGPIRNSEMRRALLAHDGERRVIAFRGGKGTADMCTKARAKGVTVVQIP